MAYPMNSERAVSDLDDLERFEASLHRSLRARERRSDAGVATIFSRKQVEQAFLETFELIGGVPRLALWANDPVNYAQFLKLLMVLAPKDVPAATQGTVLEYRSNIPRSPLSGGSVCTEVVDG